MELLVAVEADIPDGLFNDVMAFLGPYGNGIVWNDFDITSVWGMETCPQPYVNNPGMFVRTVRGAAEGQQSAIRRGLRTLSGKPATTDEFNMSSDRFLANQTRYRAQIQEELQTLLQDEPYPLEVNLNLGQALLDIGTLLNGRLNRLLSFWDLSMNTYTPEATLERCEQYPLSQWLVGVQYE